MRGLKKRPPPRRWNCADAAAATATATTSATTILTRLTRTVYATLPLRAIVDGVGRHLRPRVVPILERKDRPRLRRDVGGHLLRLFVAEAAGRQVRHRVANDAGQRVDARCAGAVVPRLGPPERSRLLVADLHALSVDAVARGAALGVDRFARARVELRDRQELVGR